MIKTRKSKIPKYKYKLRFGYGSGNGHDGVTVYGNSTTPRTWVSFIRLGDSV